VKEPALNGGIGFAGRLSYQAACIASRERSPSLEAGLCLTLESKMANPTQEQIIHRAYELWEHAGKPDHRDQEFYHQAEKELGEGATPDEKSETFLE
jgi:hypothetical protein